MIIQNALFRRWFVLQLVIWIVVMTLYGVFFMYTSQALEQQINTLYDEKIQRLTYDLDRIISEAVSEGTDYVINPMMTTMAMIQNDEEQFLNRESVRLVDEIKQSNASNQNLSDVILYFADYDRFLTSAGIMDQQVFHEIYDVEDTILSMIEEENPGKIRVVNNFGENPQGVKTLGISLKMTGGLSGDNRVVILIDRDTIQSLLSMYSNHSSELITLRLENQWVLETSNKMEEVEYTFIQSDESKYNLSVVFEIPKSLYYEEKMRFQLISLMVVGLLGIVGIMVSYYITLLKVKPILKLVEKSEQLSTMEGGEEFSLINHAMDAALLNKQVMTNHAVYIQERSWRMILQGELTIEESTAYVQELLKVKEQDSFCVFILMSPTRNLREVKKQVSEGLDSVQGLTLATLIQEEGKLIGILTLEQDLSLLEDVLKPLANSCYISMSPLVETSRRIQEAYDSALRYMSLRVLPNMKGKILSGVAEERNLEVADVTEAFDNMRMLTHEESVRFKALLQSGNCEEAMKALHRFMSHEEMSNNVFLYKLRYYDLVSIIVGAAISQQDDHLVNQVIDLLKGATLVSTYEMLMKALTDCTEKVCKAYKERQNSSNLTLNQHMLEYIHRHLTDQQLGADEVADYLNMNQAYIRQFFKEQNGIGFWDYINHERMNRVKRQLEHTNKPVLQISEALGYVSISTFGRAFKKVTGMTPGQYRKWARLKENQDHMTK